MVHIWLIYVTGWVLLWSTWGGTTWMKLPVSQLNRFEYPRKMHSTSRKKRLIKIEWNGNALKRNDSVILGFDDIFGDEPKYQRCFLKETPYHLSLLELAEWRWKITNRKPSMHVSKDHTLHVVLFLSLMTSSL